MFEFIENFLGYDLGYLEYIGIAVAFLIAGIIKGMIGFGMPVIAVSLLTIFLPINLSLGLMALPLMTSNLLQAAGSGKIFAVYRKYWPLIITLGIGIWIGANVVNSVDEGTLYLLLGSVVLLFVAGELYRPDVDIPEKLATPVGMAAGFIGGVLGGISSAYGLPLAMFLVAMRVPKEMFVACMGVFLFTGSLFLAAAFSSVNLLNLNILTLSLLALPTLVIGMRIGKYFRHRVSQNQFHKILITSLCLIALNLLRRAALEYGFL